MGGQVGHTAWTVKFVIGAVGSCFLYKIRRLTATNLKQTLLRFCYLAFTVCLISCSLWSLFPTVERLGFKKAKSFQKNPKSIMPVLIIVLVGNNLNSLKFPNSKKNSFCGNYMRKYVTCKFTYFLRKTFFLRQLFKGGNLLRKYVKLVQFYIVIT